MKINDIKIGRLLQDYADNIFQYTSRDKELICKELEKDSNINIQNAEKNMIIKQILDNKYNQFINHLKNIYNTDNIEISAKKIQTIKAKIKKLCAKDIAMAEINRNMNFNIGQNVNNLTFSS